MKAAEPKHPRTKPTRRFRSRFDAHRADGAGGVRGAPFRPVAFALGAALAAAAGIGGGAAAQETIHIGAGGIDVIVNLGALDGLGREDRREGRREGPIVIDPAMAGGEARPLRPPPLADAAVAMPVAKGAPGTGTMAGEPATGEPAGGVAPSAAPERPLAAAEAEPAPPAREPAAEKPAARAKAAREPAAEEPAARAKAATAPSATDTPAAAGEPAPDAGADSLVLRFPAGEAALPPEGAAPLARLAERLAGDETLRLRLKAYARAESGSASQTRRLSLSRALAVRSFLIERGVRSTRIDLRALGDRTEEEPADRVDVLVVER